VQGHGLDERRRVAPAAVHDRAEPAALEAELARVVGHEAVGIGEVDELVQPVREQDSAILAGEVDLTPLGGRAPRGADQLHEGGERVREDAFLRRGLDPELELARVINPAVHVRREYGGRAQALTRPLARLRYGAR
jgi:hypothetical protein